MEEVMFGYSIRGQGAFKEEKGIPGKSTEHSQHAI